MGRKGQQSERGREVRAERLTAPFSPPTPATSWDDPKNVLTIQMAKASKTIEPIRDPMTAAATAPPASLLRPSTACAATTKLETEFESDDEMSMLEANVAVGRGEASEGGMVDDGGARARTEDEDVGLPAADEDDSISVMAVSRSGSGRGS